ncbi:MAG TPA: M15 family metallopeptidase [Chitinophagaceae bacterium]|nr:M15 family metallopeptidase [Chitinophagaceae bacterium]
MKKRTDDAALVEPVARRLVTSIIEDARSHSLGLMVFEPFRSEAWQQLLFQQGAAKLQNVDLHNFGLVCDLVKNVNGDPSWKGDFSLPGELAHNYELIWGGHWGKSVHRSFIDFVRVQRCPIPRQASLFTRQWHPDKKYNPCDDL